MLSPKPAPWCGIDKKEPHYYRGLRMKTDTNLHEQLEGLIRELVPVETAHGGKPRVLDLGCGEGALSQRLYDLGYDVVSVDVDQAQFKAEGPTFMAVDFNDPSAVERFATRFGADASGDHDAERHSLDEPSQVEGFATRRSSDRSALERSAGGYPASADLILAVEVIEHLRNPWDFVALCRRLSTEKTHLVITTPNVTSWWSRFWFLLTGDLWGFNPESWKRPGHINPITPTEMRAILRENGFECLDVNAGGNLPVIWAYNWKRLLVSLVMLPLRLFMRGEKDGWVLCYHAKPRGSG